MFSGISTEIAIAITPGLLLMVIYLFWAAKTLGFYTATAICVFALLSIYDPSPHDRPGTWGRRALVTAGFVAVMYGLFAQLLGVYTPKEILFH